MHLVALTLAILCAICSAVHSLGGTERQDDRVRLRDAPIAGTWARYLDSEGADGSWTATAGTSTGVAAAAQAPLTINASVPGDLISDLHAAGEIGNPLFEYEGMRSTTSLLAPQTVDLHCYPPFRAMSQAQLPQQHPVGFRLDVHNTVFTTIAASEPCSVGDGRG